MNYIYLFMRVNLFLGIAPHLINRIRPYPCAFSKPSLIIAYKSVSLMSPYLGIFCLFTPTLLFPVFGIFSLSIHIIFSYLG